MEVQLRYIDDYKQLAIKEMERTGIPASIKIAQGLLESDAGRSYLAEKGNNHFGIKCGDDWDGAKIYKKDDDYNDKGKLVSSCFRKYEHAKLSWIAHSEFLKRNRYRSLFLLESSDYKGWAKGLQRAGYATNPAYSKHLIELIERYNLQELDKIQVKVPDVVKKTEQKATTTKEITKTDYINHVRVTYSLEGETWGSISQRTDIPVQTLLKYNELVGDASTGLETGTSVFLQPKRANSRGKTSTHRVQAGETMYLISQRYGIQLNSLYERNLMKSGDEPTVGEEIWLKGKRARAPKLKSQPTEPITKKSENKPTSANSTSDLDEDQDGHLDMEDEVRLDELEIPKLEKPTPPATQNNTDHEKENIDNSATDVYHVYYEVKASDTLYNIAKRHQITLEQLRIWNNLSDNTIKIGQLLRVK